MSLSLPDRHMGRLANVRSRWALRSEQGGGPLSEPDILVPFGGKLCNGLSQGEQILWLPEACFCPFWFIPFLLRWMQQSRPFRSQRSQRSQR